MTKWKWLEHLWRALGSAPRSRLYALLGVLLALAAPIALLFALGVPKTDDGKSAFLVVAYSTVVLFALLGHLLGRSFDEVGRLSSTDPLTGLCNRRRFEQRLNEESTRAQRYGRAASVLHVDIDRLRAINDDFGYKAGDGALVAVSRALLDNVRQVDVVARVGGDEFAVLLPDTSAAQASALSRRVLAEAAWQGDLLVSGLAISIAVTELNTALDVLVPPQRGAPPAWRALNHAAGWSTG